MLEIGTLGAYSTIWMARGIPDGGTDRHDRGRAAQRRGRAGEPRPRGRRRQGRDPRSGAPPTCCRRSRASEPFDLVFIDADKESNTIYIDWAARLGRPGTVVVVDNIGRGGEVANPATEDPR